MPGIPYWRLSSIYFCYFALLGALVPYWSLYFSHLGYGPVAIGAFVSLLQLTRIFAPSAWNRLAEHYASGTGLIRSGCFLGLISFCGLFLGARGWWLGVVVLCFSFFFNAVIAQFEGLTLRHLGDGYQRYGRVRVWGSVGFILAVLALGVLLSRLPMDLFPWLLLPLASALWLSSLLVPAAAAPMLRPQRRRAGNPLRRRAVRAFLLSCFFMQAGHGPYYAFFSIHLRDHGFGAVAIGYLWALAVVAEILLFLYIPSLLRRIGARAILLLSLLVAALRWVLLGLFLPLPGMIILIQCLHAASFGSFHGAAIELVRRLFQGARQGQGLALYAAASFGAGATFGSLTSGFLWQYGAALCFLYAAALNLAGFLVAWVWMRGAVQQRGSRV